MCAPTLFLFEVNLDLQANHIQPPQNFAPYMNIDITHLSAKEERKCVSLAISLFINMNLQTKGW